MRSLGGYAFRVDEFVLPTFTLDFDSHDELYLPGNDIPVSGRLTSFSGHPLKGARVHLTVERWGDLVDEIELRPDSDNRFSHAFKAEHEGFYAIKAEVTDATGEMQQFYTYVYVTGNIQLSLSVENAADGQYSLSGEVVPGGQIRYVPYYQRKSKDLLTDSLSMSLLAKVTNSNGDLVPMDVHYKLFHLAKDTTLVMQGVEQEPGNKTSRSGAFPRGYISSRQNAR